MCVYNEFGQVTNSTDARGFSSTSSFDDHGNLKSSTDALTNTTFYNYNANGLLITTTDPLGTVNTNVYDSSGNLIATATLTFTTSGFDPTPIATVLATNSYAYDENGNQTQSVAWRRLGTNWVGATNTLLCDAQNRVVQMIAADGGTNITVYNAGGKLIRTIDALGHTNSMEYDVQGRLTRSIFADGYFMQNFYDSGGRLTNRVDQLGHGTTNMFDALGRQVQTIYADGASTRIVYDDLGRVATNIDARGFMSVVAYDAVGRHTASTNGWTTSEATWVRFGYDLNGNQTTVTDALNHVTTTMYDALSRAVQMQYANGSNTFTGFDAVGRRVAETNQEGIVARFAYDGAGRLLAVTNGFGAAQSTWALYTYDEIGDQLTQVDALGRTTTFNYNSMGRRTSRTLPGLQMEKIGYDLGGNLVRLTNFNGVVITNQYDAMNRLTNRTSTNGYSVSFGHSATGQRVNMIDASGTTTYSYDIRGRLRAKTNAWISGPTISLNYTYDANGNLANLGSSTVGGVTNFYQFDALSRLTNALANGSAAASYTFDTAGNLDTMRYGNGVTSLFQSDVLNRLTNIVWKTNGATIASFYYQLGATGSRTNLGETVNGTSRTNAWAYDSLYRLKQEAITGGTSGTLSYSFDLVGNRTNRTSGLSGLTNQTFTFSTNDWLNADSYDNNGNTTNSSGNFYQYDALNHVTNVNSGAVLLVYNGDGNRVTKTVGATTTYYLLDDLNPSGYVQVLEEWISTSTPTLNRAYNYGLQLISQRQPGVNTNYFVFDAHGSTRVLADIAGNVANAFAFDAYGNLIASNAVPQTAYLYVGEQFDSDLGSYYLRARTYHPGTGRFATKDIYQGDTAEPLSLHKYLYCHEDPINNSDPSGLAVLLIKYKDKNGNVTNDKFQLPKMKDLTDSLDKAANSGSTSNLIDEIHLKGHGEPHLMYINGGGRLSPSSYFGDPAEYIVVKNGRILTGTGDDLTDKFRAALKKGSLIVLDGCKTARGDNPIAQEMSRALPGVVVAGGEGFAQFGGLIGSSVAIGKKNYYIDGELSNSAW